MPAKILVVDDDPTALDAIRELLAADGHQVVTRASGRAALAAIGRERPSLLVLDYAMPEMTGLEVLRELRATGDQVPAIVLSAKSDPYDKTAGYSSGADVYIGKEEDPVVLRAAVARLLGRTGKEAGRLEAGGLVVDLTTWSCQVDGREVRLPPRLFRLLRTLVASPGAVIRKEQLVYQVWGVNSDVYNRAVDNAIVDLRRLLGDGGNRTRFIHTVRGVGYKFEARS